VLRLVPPPSRATHRGPRAAVVLLAIVALVLAGCGSPKHQAEVTTSTSTPSAASDVAAPLQRFYGQTIEWSTCGKFQCAKAKMPIDYADPAAGTTEVAIERSPATSGTAIGSLLINPGGPGASGTDFVEGAVKRFGTDVLAKYDVVGFDPRGVAHSNPVKCQDDAAKNELLSEDFDYSTDAGIAAAEAAYKAMGAACAANSGALLAHVDTVSVARDLDVLRSALGDETLSYLGFSYGTLIGATYAGLFPTHVGRMVLDGALDPALDSAALGLGQAAGFESALRAYVTDCQGGPKCPLPGSVDNDAVRQRVLAGPDAGVNAGSGGRRRHAPPSPG